MARLVLAVLLVLGLGGASCHDLVPPPRNGAEPGALGEGPKVLAGVTYWQLVTAGGDPKADLPVVVGMHGRGGSPHQLSRLLAGLPTPVRVISVQGLEPFRRGYWWFDIAEPVPGAGPPGPFAEDYEQAIRTLGRFLTAAETAHGARPVLTGFSQGAMMAWVLAVRFPGRSCGAVPVSGYLPSQSYPASDAPSDPPIPPIRALHGGEDRVVDPAWDQESVRRLEELGVDISLQIFDGVAHRVDPPVRMALYARIAELAERCTPR